MGDISAYKILAPKPVKKRPVGRRGSRWQDNIGIDLTEIWWEAVDWISLVQYGD